MRYDKSNVSRREWRDQLYTETGNYKQGVKQNKEQLSWQRTNINECDSLRSVTWIPKTVQVS